MPAKIGPDGKPIVVDTVPFKADFSDNEATEPYNPSAGRAAPTDFSDSDATEPYAPGSKSSSSNAATIAIDIEEVSVQPGSSAQVTVNVVDDDEATQVFRAAKPVEAVATSSVESATVSESGAMEDPPVGWLVVVDGMGKGEFATLGFGQNSIGRSGARVNLNFGDREISRDSHVVVTFDPKSAQFFVSPGTGKSLGYLNDAPILSPVSLSDRDHLTLGSTKLMFVSLCDERFSWA
ncbi:MAG: hypothetical protein HWD83_00975 [Gammaproteobacteria bacterium]|nr:hypothetical protein [Gammaproteobacteria bacterium]